MEFPRWVPERDGRTTDEEWDVVRQLHEAHAIYIGRSEIHGVGLLAARGFAKGEAVFKFLYDPNERMQWVRMDVLAQYFTPAHKALLHNFWARNETHLYAPAFMTNPAQITSWVHYLNHHAAPNIAYDHPTGCYYALKNIAVQEEILIDYRYDLLFIFFFFLFERKWCVQNAIIVHF